MSSITLIGRWYVDGVLADPTSVTLSNPTGTYGVKRDDTDGVVVASGTPMVRTSTGVYQYVLTTPEPALRYTWWMDIVHAGAAYHVERKQADNFADSTVPVIESIMGWVCGQINDVLPANGYTYELTARRIKGLEEADTHLSNGMVYTMYGDWQSLEVTLGGTHIQSQEIICDICAVSETADLNIETKLTVMGADILRKLVASNTGISACGGFAIQAEPTGALWVPGEGCHFLEMTFTIKYATKWNDPYVQA